MAKIFCYIIGILFLCGCHNRNLSETGIKPTTFDSALLDIPVQVDTSFADTAQVMIAAPDSVASEIKIIQVKEIIPPTLKDVYTSFIGVREKTGNNDGREVEMFLRTVGLGKGYAWCAAFVKHCLLEAGIKDAKRINGMASSCVSKDLIFSGRKKLKVAKPGDVFTLYYASLKRIGHTGFFDREVNNSVFETVEGNTNDALSREGDGVYKKKRSYNATFNISRWDVEKGDGFLN